MSYEAIPTFSHAERDRRWAIAQDLMQAEGLDAMLVYGDREGTGPAPFAPDTFFTNDRPGATVIIPRGGEPIAHLFSPMSLADHAEARVRGDDPWVEPRNVRVPRSAPAVAKTLEELKLGTGRIGVLGLEPYPPFYFEGAIPHGFWVGLTERLPDATFVPSWRPFAMRTVRRSREELAVLAWAARAGDAMAQAMIDTARPGVTEAQLVAAAMEAAPAHAAVSPGVLLVTGREENNWGLPAWSYRAQKPRTLEDGDVVLSEIFTSSGMLEAQGQLTIGIGDVHPDVRRAGEAVRESYERGLAALKPGATFGDVARAMRGPVDALGGWNVAPLVHALNPFGAVSAAGEGIEALPGAADYGALGHIPTILAEMPILPGMTFAFEPKMNLGRHEVDIGSTVVVGEHHPIELNRLGREVVYV
ncbi:MAG: M24 family metallopeptidase [Deinococcales bacterium]